MDIPRAPRPKRGRYLVAALVAGVLLLAGIGLTRLEPAPPTVDRAALWTDTVQRGEMVVRVRGSGTLVPEHSVLVVTSVGGQVERVPVQNGAPVAAGDLLLELRNAEVEQQAVDAERELVELESEIVMHQAQWEQQELSLAATLADVRSAYLEAARQASIDRELLERGIISPAAAGRSQEREEDARRRLELEERRFELQTRHMEAQRRVSVSGVERQRDAALRQRGRRAGLMVRAPIDGVVQDLALDIGESVGSGQAVARIVEPDRLKAVLRISEVQVGQVTLGMPAIIDARSGEVTGSVARIDPSAQGGTVAVDIELEGPLPPGARPDLGVDGVIEIGRLDDALQVGRPVQAGADRTMRLFRLDPDGQGAVQVDVRVGRTSVNTIEILGGLTPGDIVVLSDMSRWADHDRIRVR